MVHMQQFGKNFASRFMGVLKPNRCVLYGAPDDAVLAALKPMGYVRMIPAAGFSR
jgi:hypothetical protein